MSIDPNQFAERDELRDINHRLIEELTKQENYMKQLNSDLSRLQVAIQQGGEL
jgi:hypothetical protein